MNGKRSSENWETKVFRRPFLNRRALWINRTRSVGFAREVCYPSV
ncbi:hypothetical protein NEISICOT_00356 [Neisseria sicca ATCC 29256]|uniref:Uncharacterized protein n=1 Tax=Neisseria sicca ATCC 29256 TaxID=547045 RepID=C6M1H2_NEISI|nr:hypothetical protein NEISICOT_00356 [Neisseria sicca ATCC 29256]